jgi:hypothetical protein
MIRLGKPTSESTHRQNNNCDYGPNSDPGNGPSPSGLISFLDLGQGSNTCHHTYGPKEHTPINARMARVLKKIPEKIFGELKT